MRMLRQQLDNNSLQAHHDAQRVFVLDEEDRGISRSARHEILTQPARRHTGVARLFFKVPDGVFVFFDLLAQPAELGYRFLAIVGNHCALCRIVLR